VSGRGRRVAVAALALALPLWAPPARALVPDLTTPAAVQEAVDAGVASLANEAFPDEWRIMLPGGEEVLVSTAFSRVALAARTAAMKGEELTEKQRQEQVDRGNGRIQLLVTMYGTARDFARWYQATLVVNGKDVKASFVQNERTPLRHPDGRYAARNVYVFPLEGLPPKGSVTLVVTDAPPGRKEVLRAPIDLGKFR